ncbi:hypothetical protein JCM3775_007337 [Rhodotorula graminis]|uniref:Potassium channel domain-containing protein n=1 Tax=Rhodotorula graminis (strain WP1) TaxID=578459 RepID=A0A194S394_RHOGW|nr:uncharacterized protein RHOBADRAFT_53960 [Rhodotorula graminis WP1]KPV75062.1 hypothetical protein RHOBADRAFT_53960 [Rhodotorula graminis WP1]
MHVSLDVVHAQAHPRRRAYRTEAERKRAEAERRELVLRRGTSLLAQLLCPLAPLFSLPGLTEHWYVVRGADSQIVRSRPDPPLIIAAGAVTFALAVLANLAIVLRLVETHPRFFSVTTIVFLSVHIAVNAVALTIFGIEHAKPDGYVLSTAFWLTAASGCVALAAVGCLFVDGLATQWYVRGGTGISGKQRSLVVAFDAFIFLILIGSVTYRYLIPDVTFLDTVYLCVQSLLTVGFGGKSSAPHDVVPSTTGAQVFSLFFNTIGILTFALLVAFTRETALEAMQTEYRAQEQLLLNRLRHRWHGERTHRAGFIAHAVAFLSFGLYHTREQQEEEQEAGADERDRGSLGQEDGEVIEDEKEGLDEQRYEEAITELKKERDREFRSQLVVSFTLFLVFWLVGAAAFSALEGWSYWIAFYFVFVMSSSIGYGDYSPSTQGGRAFFVVWAILGAGTLTVLFSVLADAYTSRFKETFQRSWVNRLWIRLTQPSHEVADELAREESQAFPKAPATRPSTPTSSERAAKGPGKEYPELAPAPSSSTATKGGGVGAGGGSSELSSQDKMLELLRLTRQHLDRLILADGDEKDEHLDRVVRKVMDNEGFSRRNREHVENDNSFKEFIYLRSLRTKLAELEELAHDAFEPADEASERREGESDLRRSRGKDSESL